MQLNISQNKSLTAFAMIVDINAFTPMTNIAECNDVPIAQFISDTLSGSIQSIEKAGGMVVGFMGDAFLALLETTDQVSQSCIGIAVDVDKMNDYFNSEFETFPITKKGLKIKIGIEYGVIDISEIRSSFLGKQKLFLGSTINYASRIIGGGKPNNNRCLFGPKALAAGLDCWPYEGPFKIKGKKGEQEYEYYNLDLGDIWRNDSKETSWR